MHQKAYSTFEIKSIDDEQRVIVGIASTPDTDRGGDELASKGAQFSLPMPFKWEHKGTVGNVVAAEVRPEGIEIRAVIPKVSEPGLLKEQVDFAWQSIKYKLARGLSIGWKPLQATMNVKGGLTVAKWLWVETSAVSIPMNANATITLIKSLDDAQLAASGTGRTASRPTPGASGRPQGSSMNVSEQIVEQRAALQTKTARLQELMTDDDTNGGLQPEEVTERDTLTTEVKSITAKLGHLGALEAAMAAQATNVTMPAVTQTRTATRIEFPKKELPKGTLFTRYALAVAAGKGSYSDTIAYAKRFSDTPEIAAYVKSMWENKAVEGTSVVASPGWGGELVNPNTAMTEFVELLMPMTIIGRVQGFRRVPFNIPIITQTGGSTFEWVGEGGQKPVGELAFVRDTLGYTKCAGIVVLTEELVRFSSPSAEATARQDLMEQCAKFLDEQFIQVGVSAGANNPASITNGVTSPAASGTSVAALRADLMAALQTFTAASIPITGLAVVTTPDVALGISMLTNELGQTPNGFNVTPTGGTLMGYQVVVSESVDPGVIVIFKPSEIFLADDGQVRLDSSNQATLDMNTGSPTSPSFNLWQRNCVGLRAERFINWKKRRADVVAVIDTAAYGPTTESP